MAQGPPGVVHFPLDGAHSRKAGGAQQVEDHKAVSAQGGEVGAHGGQQAGILLRQIGAQTEEHAEGGHHVLLGDEAGNGGHGGLPGAEAQGA